MGKVTVETSIFQFSVFSMTVKKMTCIVTCDQESSTFSKNMTDSNSVSESMTHNFDSER